MNINIEETIKALSIALDLAEISSMENKVIIEDVTNINYSEHNYIHHSRRTTYIALSIAKELMLKQETTINLYVSSLLHDIGATNSLIKSHNSSFFIKQHCINGAKILEEFPVFNNISHVILYHHENFNGSGTMKLKGEEIPIESQIIRLSDLVELIYDENLPAFKQKKHIIDWITSRKNILFSEKLVNTFLKISSKDIFWFDLENIHYVNNILERISPKLDIYIGIDDFVTIANIFSKVIDTKSKFTAEHSKGISNLAFSVAKYLNYPEEKCIKMKIAGLLHDIGKLAIPTKILDKNGALTDEEFSIIKSHPYYTDIILSNIKNIDDIRTWASNHHEKLNGTGYPKGLTSKDLDEESKILAVCDIYQALTEDRPYRKGLSPKKSFSIIDNMVEENFISKTAVDCLKNTLNFSYTE